MRDPEQPLTLGDFAGLFSCVESLLFVSSVLAQLDADGTAKLGREQLISPQVITSSYFNANYGFRLGRVTYNSPVDLWLMAGHAAVLASSATAIMGGVCSASYLAAKKAVDLWRLGIAAQKERSEAQMVAAEARMVMLMPGLESRMSISSWH